MLHDPAGQDAWDGDLRIVVMTRSRLDDEVGADPLLGSAARSWLIEALDNAGAGYRALVGTVTRVLSETFGGLELTADSTTTLGATSTAGAGRARRQRPDPPPHPRAALWAAPKPAAGGFFFFISQWCLEHQ